MKRALSFWLGLAVAGLLVLVLAPLQAQAPDANTGTIHGRVTNPTGQPQGGGTVSLSTDGGATLEYTFIVTHSGEYAGEAHQGTYMVIYRAADTPAGKIVDSIRGVEIVAGQDTAQDFDMSRQEYIDKMTAAQREQLENLKKANAVALKANEIINVLNADLKTCNQDIKDGDSAIDAETKAAKYGECESLMLRDTQTKPDESVLWVLLGRAQAGLMKYADAESSLRRALELNNAAPRPNVQIQSLVNSELEKIHARASVAAEPATDAAQESRPAEVSGKYNLQGQDAQLDFVSSTGCTMLVRGSKQGNGSYRVNGDTLWLNCSSTRASFQFKIQEDRLVAGNGQIWVREGSAQESIPTPMPDIAPPPPPADAPPPTIALGQTMDQVTVGFGQPLKVAKVGTKVIYYYKDMKVTFTNGKVSNVE